MVKIYLLYNSPRAIVNKNTVNDAFLFASPDNLTSSVFITQIRKSPKVSESHSVRQTWHKEVTLPGPIPPFLGLCHYLVCQRLLLQIEIPTLFMWQCSKLSTANEVFMEYAASTSLDTNLHASSFLVHAFLYRWHAVVIILALSRKDNFLFMAYHYIFWVNLIYTPVQYIIS